MLMKFFNLCSYLSAPIPQIRTVLPTLFILASMMHQNKGKSEDQELIPLFADTYLHEMKVCHSKKPSLWSINFKTLFSQLDGLISKDWHINTCVASNVQLWHFYLFLLICIVSEMCEVLCKLFPFNFLKTFHLILKNFLISEPFLHIFLLFSASSFKQYRGGVVLFEYYIN